jgi:hypothetical protein
MKSGLSLLAGLGLGASLMYIFDPRMGRRRRALVRDKAVRLAHKAEEAAEVVGRDFKSRAQGLGAGDLSVLVGGKRALSNPLRGSWSPTGRALLAGAGAGLFLYWLTRSAPTACVLGTVGCALVAEGFTNAGLDDIVGAARGLTEKARGAAEDIAERARDATQSVSSSVGLEAPSFAAGI